jgi:hypothetical protein
MNGSHDSNEQAIPAGATATVGSSPAASSDPSGGVPATAAGTSPPATAYFPQLSRATVADPRSKTPLLACVLSIMPGLGQVYVGYYPRGFAHAIIVALLITLLATGDMDELAPLAGIFLAFFWLYNIIDAGRRAALYNQALAGNEEIEPPRDFKMPSFGGSVMGGLAFLVVGIVALSNTLFDIPLYWVEEWWPVLPIAFGAYLLIKAIRDRGDGAAEGARR